MDLRTVRAVVRRRQRRRQVAGFPVLPTLGLLFITTQSTVMTSVAGLALAVALVVGAVGGAVTAYDNFIRTLPLPETVGEQTTEQFKTTRIYDRTGQTVLYEIYDPQGGNRTVIPLDQIPLNLRLASIALEDKDFYTNPGFDVRGLGRALVNNWLGLPIQGGSSITQQLVKNVAIEPDERAARSYERKLREVVLAWELTRRYPDVEGKNQILEWYLNTVYFGHLAYGVQAAAETYFGKSAADLTLAEAAMLATLPRSPGANPIDDPDEARRQQAIALDEMVEEGYITRGQADEARRAPLGPPRRRTERASLLAPHFAVWVRQLLEQRYGPERLYRGGLQVITSLDLRLQGLAENTARAHVARLQAADKNVTNASVVSLDPTTGQVLAMLGSIDYWDADIEGQVNVALSPRQPGSAFKPITYATAFGQGYTPATMILDVRTTFPQPGRPPYVPENYDRKYHGPVLLRTALANSYNIPAVKLLEMVGIPNTQAMAHHMGINGLNGQYGLALTLGGGEVTLLDLTYVYSVLAAQGRMLGAPVPDLRRRIGYRELDPAPILRVTDSIGNVLDDFSTPEERVVLTPQQAFLVTDILSDNQAREPAFGPNSPLHLNRPAAAKTGTTNDWRDNWTVGYTPQLVTGVWVGNANGQPMREVSGVDGAAPIWHDFMLAALDGQPPLPFARPDDLEWVEVCGLSGLRSTALCPDRRGEWFIAGTAPTEPDNIYQKLRLCRATGRLAGPNCPPEAIEERVYAVLPSEAADWAKAADIPQPPPAEGEALVTGGGSVVLSSPSPQSFVRGAVPIMGMVAGNDLVRWRVQVGEGVNPERWRVLAEGGAALGGRLAMWDTRELNGVYTLRVAVERRTGVEDVLRLPVTVDTEPPAIELVGVPAEINLERDEFVNIIAEAEDNLSIERVDFLLDGKPLGSATVAPYAIRWTPTDRQLGRHYIEVIAHDRAGNTTAAPRASIEVIKQR